MILAFQGRSTYRAVLTPSTICLLCDRYQTVTNLAGAAGSRLLLRLRMPTKRTKATGTPQVETVMTGTTMAHQMKLHGAQEVATVTRTDRQSPAQRSQRPPSRGSRVELPMQLNHDKTRKRRIQEQLLGTEAGMCLMMFPRGHQHRKGINNQSTLRLSSSSSRSRHLVNGQSKTKGPMMAGRAGEMKTRTNLVMKVAPGVLQTRGLLEVLAGRGDSAFGVIRP